MKIVAVAAGSPLVEQILDLWRHNRRTLGFMPRQGFVDRATRGSLLAALDNDGRVAGYLLFDLQRDAAKIIHVCVRDGQRRHGVSERLVEDLISRYDGLNRLYLRCRQDWDAKHVWPRLGFAVEGTVRGRSKTGDALDVWVRWLGQPDLFTWAPSAEISTVSAVIDANIFFDLHLEHRHDDESRLLTEGWVATEVELLVTDELPREITRGDDETSKHHLRACLPRYRRVRRPAPEWTPIYEDLKTRVASLDVRTESDLRHLAMTAGAGVPYFVTKDHELRDRLGEHLRQRWSVEALSPVAFVVAVDELVRSDAYRPVQLQGTRYQWGRVRGEHVDGLAHRFLNGEDDERLARFRRRLQDVVSSPRRVDVRVVSDGDSKPAALVATQSERGSLRSPLMRVAGGPIAETVARQLLSLLRSKAREESLTRVVISDPHPSPAIEAMCPAEGFFRAGGTWQAYLLDRRVSTAELSEELASLQPEDTHPVAQQLLDRLVEGAVLTSAQAVDVERCLWPLKVRDAELPTFLVPIRPGFALDLFGWPKGQQTLFTRPEQLGISREHVYYRNPAAARGLAAPARILWYVSRNRDFPESGGIWACSLLLNLLIADPDHLIRRFEHLGVYSPQQVRAVADADGRVMALRFENTELFPAPVPLESARLLARDSRHTLSLESPSRVPPEFFASAYERGWSHART